MRVEATAGYLRERLPDGLATVTELRRDDAGWQARSVEGWVRVELRAQNLRWLPPLLAGLDRPFLVDAPAELRDEVRRLGESLQEIAAES